MTNPKNSLRIVYMGTPDFAVESLRRLVEGGYNVVGVVTMPDKPMGRHQTTLSASPVKQYAEAKGLRVLQPVRLKDETFLDELRSLRADLQIVVAFRMLPEAVWAMPRLGTFNLHASLLPQYRGAAPINWAVINGEKETGVTTFFLKHVIDTGNIIRQARIPIGQDDDAGTVHDRLMTLGGTLVVETVDALLAGDVTTTPQPDDACTKPAPKIFRDTCRIDWNATLRQVHDFVRGLSPYPAAWTEMQTGDRLQTFKIFRTACEFVAQPAEKPGTVLTDGRTTLKVALTDGYLHILSLQQAGKRRMDTADFLRGLRTGEMLTLPGF